MLTQIKLMADLHAMLDNLKAPWELVEARAQYYRLTIQAVLKAIGVPLDKLEFILGSDYQYSKPYQADLFRLSAITTEHDAKKAGAEVVKQVESPLLSGLIYPLMQALDEQHLDVDAQFGGVDQRKIFTFAGEQLPKLGYKERAHLMNPMVPGLAGGKMSASDPDSKIDLLDTPDMVRKKIRKAFAAPKDPNNGLISFVEFVLLPVSALKHDSEKGKFVVERKEGEPLVYDNVEDVRKDYVEDRLTPQLLKQGVTDGLNELLAPIQAEFQANEEWQQVTLKAYPPPAPIKKEGKKKEKKVGTKAPIREKPQKQQPAVVAQPDGHVEGPNKAAVDVGKPS
jgi:tyrosyl-tRNA synthetase